MTTRNLIIIGSGPAGYTAAIYAARAGLAPLVIAGSVTAGGALMTTTDVENFPGFPEGIQGPDLMDNLSQQAEQFGAEIVYDDVTSTDLTGDVKTVITVGGEQYTALAVIVATGSAHKHLDVPGEEVLSGRGVSFCATCDGFFFRNRDIAVVGGGDSAAEEAIFLTRFARTVYLIVRRDELRASKVMADRVLTNPKIHVMWNSTVTEVEGESRVESVKVQDTRFGGPAGSLPVSAVFVAIGHIPRSEVFGGQLATDSDGYIVTAPGGALSDGRRTRTSVPGVFACGDVVDRTYRQAITAAGSGCQAALDAQTFLEGVFA